MNLIELSFNFFFNLQINRFYLNDFIAETESWHMLSNSPGKGVNSDVLPPARHKHSAVLHDDAMWIYGGMTDLQERSDLWKWDIVSKLWTVVKTKQNPGPLHSHAACRLPSSMLVFGGERNGLSTNDLWKFNFSKFFTSIIFTLMHLIIIIFFY